MATIQLGKRGQEYATELACEPVITSQVALERRQPEQVKIVTGEAEWEPSHNFPVYVTLPVDEAVKFAKDILAAVCYEHPKPIDSSEVGEPLPLME